MNGGIKAMKIYEIQEAKERQIQEYYVLSSMTIDKILSMLKPEERSVIEFIIKKESLDFTLMTPNE